MVMMIKAAIPVALLGFAASYMDIVGDLLNTVKASLVGIELSAIDDAMQRERFMSSDSRQDPFPADQAAFETFLTNAFEDRGRDNSVDQFGTKYAYTHPENSDVYTIASAGPDKEFGSTDDIVLERDGKKRTMTKELKDIASDMEGEIESEKERKEQQISDLNDAITDANGDSNGDTVGAAGGNVSDLRNSVSGLIDSAQESLQGLQDSIDLGEQAQPLEWDEDLEGLGAGE